MGNVYHIAMCSHCDRPIDCTQNIMVHRAVNFEKAAKLLNEPKNTFEMVARQFCAYCGGHIPCGCDHPDPQA